MFCYDQAMDGGVQMKKFLDVLAKTVLGATIAAVVGAIGYGIFESLTWESAIVLTGLIVYAGVLAWALDRWCD